MDKKVVIVDVLRASTSIVTALAHGAKKVIPVRTPGEARKMAESLSNESTLLCGERQSVKINGFDLGNSPREYSENAVYGKVLVFTSTNGSRAILNVKEADQILIGGFINMRAIVQMLASDDKDSLVFCSGHQDGFSLEDVVCAGMIVDGLKKNIPEGEYLITDEALASCLLYERFANDLESMVIHSYWGKYLTDLGMGDDLPQCVSVDAFDLIPVLKGSALVNETHMDG